jgi:hypothetical protein
LNSVWWPRTTLRTVARDTDSVRTISLMERCTLSISESGRSVGA